MAQNDPQGSANTVKKQYQWLLGGVVAMLAVAGIVWTSLLFIADYEYRGVKDPNASERSRAVLTQYRLTLENILKLDPTNGEIRNRYANVLGILGDKQEAVKQLKIAQHTHNAQDSLFFLADIHEKLGDFEQAESIMNDCVVINPIQIKFNDSRIRMMARKLERIDPKTDPEIYKQALDEYGQAARDWSIRAPHDPNAHLFMGNLYVRVRPLYALQAYRAYLMGLSDNVNWMNLDIDLMIAPRDAMGTIDQIINGRHAKAYKNLP